MPVCILLLSLDSLISPNVLVHILIKHSKLSQGKRMVRLIEQCSNKAISRGIWHGDWVMTVMNVIVMSVTLWEEWLNGSHRSFLHFDWWLQFSFGSCPSMHCFLMRCHLYLSLPPELMCDQQPPWKCSQGSRRVYVEFLFLDTRNQKQKQVIFTVCRGELLEIWQLWKQARKT